VCHYYLAGMCPYEEFERTKHDVGPCPLALGHDEALKAEFDVRRLSPLTGHLCPSCVEHTGLCKRRQQTLAKMPLDYIAESLCPMKALHWQPGQLRKLQKNK